jgi:hypothetical protein
VGDEEEEEGGEEGREWIEEEIGVQRKSCVSVFVLEEAEEEGEEEH